MAKAKAKPATKTAAKKSATAKKKPTAKTKSSASKSPAKKSSTAAKTTANKKAPAKRKVSAAAVAQAPVDSQFRNFEPYQPKKNEPYMNEPQLAHFRTILINWRQQLMEEVDRTVHHMQDEAANFPDPADRATQEEEFSIELRTRDRERKLIRKIDQTIDRLDQEDYGYCDTCGIEIGLRRLEARPTATQCVDCKSLDEIKEKQIRG